MTWPRELIEVVRTRAESRCEYCKMHQSLQGATFHVEHIIPRCQGGNSDLENLAWACPGCNLKKQATIQAFDPESGLLVSIFHPRDSVWADHFHWNDLHLAGKTSTGRATVALLDLNHPRRIQIREAESLFGLFPPKEED